MGRVPKVLVDINSPQSVVDYMSRIQRVLDTQVEIGSPQDPRDPASTTLADGVVHNGTILNGAGSWVEIDLNDTTHPLNSNVACVHNLGLQVISASKPNVLWQVCSLIHSGLGTGAGSAISVVYTDGAVTSNSIQLRFHAAARTVNVANPLTVALWFTAR